MMDTKNKNVRTSTLLDTDHEYGLSAEQVAERQEEFGLNIIRHDKKISPWKVFFDQFKNFLMIILIFATGVSFLSGDKVEAIVIVAIIILNAILGFIQEYNAEKSIENLKKMTSLKIRVLRDQQEMLINSEELTLGDIMIIEAGDKIGADALLIETHSLEISEALLTGESYPIEKKVIDLPEDIPLAEQVNKVFAGTVVTKGRGIAIVSEIGMQTEIGKIASMIQEAPDKETKLQKDLNILSKRLAAVIFGICIIVFVINLVMGEPLHDAFMVAIALSVAAIPEGLPTIVTICLGIGVKKLVAKNALVKKLGSVETLGSVNVICTDKTGTLTKNEMTVKELFVDNQIFHVNGSGYAMHPEDIIQETSKNRDFLLRIGALCNSADLSSSDAIGDPTELALLVSAEKGGILVKEEEKSYLFEHENPFDSGRKIMSVSRKKDGQHFLFSKGAPEELLERCTHIMINDKLQKLTKKQRNQILEVNENFAKKALRVLGFAYKITDTLDIEEDNLIFVGLQGIIDPPRPEARDAIATCVQAGIRVIMITGDHLTTAQAIAEDLGIHGNAIEGSVFEQLSAKEQKKQILTTNVFARVSPEHKQHIVKLLKESGDIVAMTGDGVNDAPALKFADIGIAMGQTGTEVTKEAADMILLDDNFSTIVHAVEEGRGIYNNIKKFVNFLFASNFAEILLILIALLCGLPLPLIAIQILWINIITDGLPALALGVDENAPDIMQNKPRKANEKILNHNMVKNILFFAGIIALGCLAFFWYNIGDLALARTGAFFLLISSEFLVIQGIRAKYHVPLRSNIWLFIAIIVSIFLTLMIIYFPFCNKIFSLSPLDGSAWLIIGIILIIQSLILLVSQKKFSHFSLENKR